MAGSYNKITLIGNLGRDPDSRMMPSGEQVTSFSVATSERWRARDGQQQERTTWFRVSAFGKLADTCSQYLHKGSYVYVEGTLSQQEYNDREGNARTSLEVRAREMRMLDKASDRGDFSGDMGTGGPAQSVPQTAAAGNDDLNMDDIPF